MNNLKLLLFFIFATLSCTACTHKDMVSTQTIHHFTETINALKNETNLPVVFPAQVPYSTTTRYASYTLTPNGYSINIDPAKECHGAHYCNIGMLLVEPNKTPETQYDQNHQEITEIVTLTDGQQAYYTPAHAMGDYWPTMLQWSKNGVRYTLTWNIKPDVEKQQIIQMAGTMPSP